MNVEMTLDSAIAFCGLKRGDVFWLRRVDEYPVRRISYLCKMNVLDIKKIHVCGAVPYSDDKGVFRGMEFLTTDFYPVMH